jgi:hypothetical protein
MVVMVGARQQRSILVRGRNIISISRVIVSFLLAECFEAFQRLFFLGV